MWLASTCTVSLGLAQQCQNSVFLLCLVISVAVTQTWYVPEWQGAAAQLLLLRVREPACITNLEYNVLYSILSKFKICPVSFIKAKIFL